MSINNSAQKIMIQNGRQDKKGGRNDRNKAVLNHTTPNNSKLSITCSNHEDNVQVDADYNTEEDLQNSLLPRKKKYEYAPAIRDEAGD